MSFGISHCWRNRNTIVTGDILFAVIANVFPTINIVCRERDLTPPHAQSKSPHLVNRSEIEREHFFAASMLRCCNSSTTMIFPSQVFLMIQRDLTRSANVLFSSWALVDGWDLFYTAARNTATISRKKQRTTFFYDDEWNKSSSNCCCFWSLSYPFHELLEWLEVEMVLEFPKLANELVRVECGPR